MTPRVHPVRRAALRWLSPGVLGGVRPDLWRRLRSAHGIDAPYLARAAVISRAARENERDAHRQRDALDGLADVTVQAPLFVLGHYRAGTTRLHHLLATDPQWHAPTLVEVTNPWTFAVDASRRVRRLRRLLPSTRVYDAVAVHPAMPMEDEFAIAAMSGASHLLRYAFPHDWNRFERFLTLDHATDDEVRQWRDALLHFAQSLTRFNGKPLVLKSPPHTAKIPHLLALFPDARFVFLHRHPYEIAASMEAMIQTTLPISTLHRATPDVADAVDQTFATTVRAYLRDRSRIPSGRLVEVAYDDLVADPVETVAGIYRQLELPEADAARARLAEVIGGEAPFPRNVRPPLAEARRRSIAARCPEAFEAWGYQR